MTVINPAPLLCRFYCRSAIPRVGAADRGNEASRHENGAGALSGPPKAEPGSPAPTASGWHALGSHLATHRHDAAHNK